MYRLLEAVIPKEKKESIEEILSKSKIIDFWREELYHDKIIYKILVKTEFSQNIIDKLSKNFSKEENFRIIVMDVNATIPINEEENRYKKIKISREELYSKIVNYTKINYIYLFMIVLSTIVATYGIILDNTAVIIGAMVIAPLLGPNIAISFASVIGDLELETNAFKTFFIGVFISFVLAFIIGFFYHLNPDLNSELSSRTVLNMGEIFIAIASGLAGVLAFTTGASESLVGVMVAISLLPPIVSSAILLSNGFLFLSLKSFLLFFENFISLNLAGILMFVYQGIKAKNWWQEKKAKEHRKKSFIIWSVLLVILIIVVYVDKFYLEH